MIQAFCLLGPIYAVIVAILYFFPESRKDNPWVGVMVLGILFETAFLIYSLMINLPYIILAVGAILIPAAVAFRIAVPGIITLRDESKSRLDHAPYIEIEKPGLLKRLAAPIQRRIK